VKAVLLGIISRNLRLGGRGEYTKLLRGCKHARRANLLLKPLKTIKNRKKLGCVLAQLGGASLSP